MGRGRDSLPGRAAAPGQDVLQLLGRDAREWNQRKSIDELTEVSHPSVCAPSPA